MFLLIFQSNVSSVPSDYNKILIIHEGSLINRKTLSILDQSFIGGRAGQGAGWPFLIKK